MPNFSRAIVASVVMFAFLMSSLPTPAQDLVPISSLTGGSSVFVFRNSAHAARRTTPMAKPTRTKQQRLETVAKINKQYTNVSRAQPNRVVAKVVDPAKVPKNVGTLGPVAGSKIFAGVGEYYLAQQDTEKALDFFRDAVDLDKTNKAASDGLSETLAIKGNDLLAKDAAGLAKGYFLEALKYNPVNSAAYFGLGEVYSQLDQTKDAITAYEKSLATDKELTEIYVPLGILYYQSGEIAKADELLTKAIAGTGANSPETQFFYGLVRLAQGNDGEALKGFQKSDQTQAETFYYTGVALQRLRRPAEAVPMLKKATEMKPGYFDALFSLGEANYEIGKWDDAAAAYRAAIKLKSTDWSSYAGLGEALRQGGHFDEAAGYYRNAANFYSQQKDFNKDTVADLYSKVGLSLGQQCDINMQRFMVCDWPATIKALQQAADLSNSPVEQINLGWAYFRSGHTDADSKDMASAKPKLEKARDILVKAATAGGESANFANQNLAAVQIDLGDYKGAIDTLGKLLKNKPDLNFAKYALGVAYFKNADAANAEKWLREAAKAEPTNVAYLMGLGDVLINRRNGKDARKLADQIRPLNPQAAASLDAKIKLSRL